MFSHASLVQFLASALLHFPCLTCPVNPLSRYKVIMSVVSPNGDMHTNPLSIKFAFLGPIGQTLIGKPPLLLIAASKGQPSYVPLEIMSTIGNKYRVVVHMSDNSLQSDFPSFRVTSLDSLDPIVEPQPYPVKDSGKGSAILDKSLPDPVTPSTSAAVPPPVTPITPFLGTSNETQGASKDPLLGPEDTAGRANTIPANPAKRPLAQDIAPSKKFARDLFPLTKESQSNKSPTET